MCRLANREYLIENANVWAVQFIDALSADVTLGAIRWDRRLRRSIATAEWCEAGGVIRLSWKDYPKVSPRDRIPIIAHEVCHLAVWSSFGEVYDNHGHEWESFMRQLGYPPEQIYYL